MADAGMGIGVDGGAASGLGITFLSGTKSVTRANFFSSSFLSGVVAASLVTILSTMDFLEC